MKSLELNSRIELLGNLVSKQVMLRYFADGEAITQVDIVTKRKRADKSEQADYFTVNLRGELAEQMAQLGQAGHGLYIVASLKQTRDNAGKLLSGIQVEQLQFIGEKAQLTWNKLSIVGKIDALSVLGKSAAKQQASLRLTLAYNPQAEEESISCQLWGFPAEWLAKQAQLQQGVLIDGELRQYKPTADSPVKLSVAGRTCQLFKRDKPFNH